MADSAIVLCNPLCFLLCRYGRDAVKQLKSALLDFYSAADLATAKRKLLDDVNRMNKNVTLPHVPDRREDELRCVRIVDDTFSVLDCLDENLLLRHLPKYVADSPGAMSSMRLYKGSLAVIMRLLERMDGQIGELRSQMAAILEQVQAFQRSTTIQMSYVGGQRPRSHLGPRLYLHLSCIIKTLAMRWAVVSASQLCPAQLSTEISAM